MPPASSQRGRARTHGYASSSGPLFFTLPTAFETGRLTNTSSFAGFISADAASGSPFIHRSQVSGSKMAGMRLWN